MENLPKIPLEDLFTEIPVQEMPLRWLSVKNAIDILGVTERQVRNYIRHGKVECIRKIVNGRKRVFISNRSVYNLLDKRDTDKYIDDTPEEEQEEDNFLLDGFIGLGEIVAKL